MGLGPGVGGGGAVGSARPPPHPEGPRHGSRRDPLTWREAQLTLIRANSPGVGDPALWGSLGCGDQHRGQGPTRAAGASGDKAQHGLGRGKARLGMRVPPTPVPKPSPPTPPIVFGGGAFGRWRGPGLGRGRKGNLLGWLVILDFRLQDCQASVQDTGKHRTRASGQTPTAGWTWTQNERGHRWARPRGTGGPVEGLF